MALLRNIGSKPVIRVDGYFLFQVGAAIRPLAGIDASATRGSLVGAVWHAESLLDGLLNKSVYRLHTCRPKGAELLGTLRRLQSEWTDSASKMADPIEYFDHFVLTTQSRDFETVLGAELQSGQLYLVSPKGGFDLAQLTENGLSLFPEDLPTKVPSAIADAKESARCIAFELATAAAFHLHRVNELVMRRYYDFVTSGKPHPDSRTIGAYIDAMKNHKAGDKVVLGALATLKGLHRNPVIHPEQRLESIGDALALYGTVHGVVAYMLRALPPPVLTLTHSPGVVSNEQESETGPGPERRVASVATSSV